MAGSRSLLGLVFFYHRSWVLPWGYYVFQAAWGKTRSEGSVESNFAQGCRFCLRCVFSLEYLMPGRHSEVKREILLAGSLRPLSPFFFRKVAEAVLVLLAAILYVCLFCNIFCLVLKMNQREKNTRGATWWMQKPHHQVEALNEELQLDFISRHKTPWKMGVCNGKAIADTTLTWTLPMVTLSLYIAI